ncbi:MULTISPECIES: sensor histidine kinase [unclassified Paenibacillus]|uniref:sensor histidine kinase n=1 Tax=unclassified Paenibacillus TaxID=185978 RepID=UPI0015A4AAA3|nr:MULTISPECIES: ATP-binding protein [unclassified Paenibacillus]
MIRELEQENIRAQLGLKVGDIVVLVDHLPPEESPSVQKWKMVEQARSLTVIREGERIDISIDIPSTTIGDMIPIVQELVCLIMAALLWFKVRRSKSSVMLAAVFLTIATIYMSLGASVRGDAVGKLLITGFMMVLPVVFYHFLVVFFEEKSGLTLPSRMLSYLYAFVGAGLVVRLLYFYPPMSFTVYQYSPTISLIFFVIGFACIMVVLSRLYVRKKKEAGHVISIITSIWAAFFISFLPVICFSFLPIIFTGQSIMDARFTSGFILFFPISFAYLIASDQLYDIGLVLRRFLFTCLLAVVPVVVFTSVYVFMFHRNSDYSQIIFLFVGLMIMVSLVLYAAEHWTTRLEPYLFPRKFMLQAALKKISRNLGNISNLRELRELILVDIVATLQVSGSAIVFCYENDMEIVHEGKIDPAEIRQLIQSSSLLQNRYLTCIEMNRHEAYTSYLIITRKKTNTMLAKEELQWLHLITSYLEVSLENVHLIRKLTFRLQEMASQLPQENSARDIQWFRKVMFDLQEEERVRIATELHDTTLQDLFFLKRRLTGLADSAAMHKEEQEPLRGMINYVEMINESLRQSCFELNPYLLKEVGLIKTLNMYLEKEAYTTPFELEFKVEPVPVIEENGMATERHLFRIVQELLNNAKKHSQATKVSFHITEADGRLRLVYEDDGVGFDEQEEVRLQIGASGLGLEQMRTRVLQMGGEIEYITQKGKGTKVVIMVPTERGKQK